MRSIMRLRWVIAATLLLPAPAFASSVIYACFGSGTLTTNPLKSCPVASVRSAIDSLSFGGSDLVKFLAGGGASSQVSFSNITLLKQQNPASDTLLSDIYAGKQLGTVAIALYGDGSGPSNPALHILLTNAYVTGWQVSADSGSPLAESVSLAFSSITIVDNATGQKVTWTQ